MVVRGDEGGALAPVPVQRSQAGQLAVLQPAVAAGHRGVVRHVRDEVASGEGRQSARPHGQGRPCCHHSHSRPLLAMSPQSRAGARTTEAVQPAHYMRLIG